MLLLCKYLPFVTESIVLANVIGYLLSSHVLKYHFGTTSKTKYSLVRTSSKNQIYHPLAYFGLKLVKFLKIPILSRDLLTSVVRSNVILLCVRKAEQKNATEIWIIIIVLVFFAVKNI